MATLTWLNRPLSKTVPHVDRNGVPNLVNMLADAKAPGAFVTEDNALLWELRAKLPAHAVLISRHWHAPGDDDFLRAIQVVGSRDPRVLASAWLDATRYFLDEAPPGTYWQSYNEPVLSPVDLELYSKFEAERLRLLNQLGHFGCIYNFSTGVPQISQWWYLQEGLEAAHRYHAIVGLHEYGGGDMWTWYGPNQDQAYELKAVNKFPEQYAVVNWLFGRYRQVYMNWIYPRRWTNIRIAITETALDRVGMSTPVMDYYGQAPEFWQGMLGAFDRVHHDHPLWNGSTDWYLKNIKWADWQMSLDPYVVFGAYFTFGYWSPSWRETDHATIAPNIFAETFKARPTKLRYNAKWNAAVMAAKARRYFQ